MCTKAIRSQKSIARDHATAASFVGTDADGAAHFWSYLDQTIVVVDGTDAETYHIDRTPCDDLGDWRRHVATKRGWSDCRIGNAIDEALEALA